MQLAGEAASLVGDQPFTELGLFDDQLVRLPGQFFAATYVGFDQAPGEPWPSGQGEHPQHILGIRQLEAFTPVDGEIHHEEAGDPADEVGVASEREAGCEDQCQRDHELVLGHAQTGPAHQHQAGPDRTHHRPPATAAEQDADGHGGPHRDGAVHVGHQSLARARQNERQRQQDVGPRQAEREPHGPTL